MEYKLTIDGVDRDSREQKIEFSIIEDSDKLLVKVGYQEIFIDIANVYNVQKLVQLKDNK